jgi:hypothetical protein
MAYADLTYYKTTYLGTSVIDAETTKWLSRAADDIDAMGSIDVDELTASQLELLKKANCAQAEYYVSNGAIYNEGVQSASIGKFSYSGKSSSGMQGLLSSRAMQYLLTAGLGGSMVDVAGYAYVN